MADRDPRLEAAIRNGLSRVDAGSAEARQAVYDAAARSLDRQFEARGAGRSEQARLLRAKLSATVAFIEDSYLTPLLVEDLDDLSNHLRNMGEPAAGQDQQSAPAARGASGKPRRRVLLWSVGFALAAGAAGALIYAGPKVWPLAGPVEAVAYEAAPPFPLVHGNGFVTAHNAAAKFVTISNKAARTGNAGLLPSVRLSSELEDRFSGRTIEVTFSARATAGAAPTQAVAVYYTDGAGNSGPRTFPLGADYSDATFTYDVPKRGAKPGNDYVGIAPASPDANASIDIRSIRIRLKPAG
jgi:hypothetical protein